ncbi:MAG: glycosyltransferase N-terminal domain-containing protein [Phycisphaerae bacterium]
MALLLDCAYLVAALLYAPLLIFQMIFRGKYRRGWRERFGRYPPRVGTRPCIWIHGVSLGEINATRSLVAEIARRLPRYELLITATTQTGYDAAVKAYAPTPVFRFPLDFSWVVSRALDRLRPDAIILMELEVWPNLVALADRRGIPVGIANGRITHERSMRRFSLPLVRTVARKMFGRLAFVGAQDETYAQRFRQLGVAADRVAVTGSVKYDTALVADAVPGSDDLARALSIRRDCPLLVAGSTGPDEEPLLLDAYAALLKEHPRLQLALVPRKPERFDEVAALIERRGLACLRRTQHPDLRGQDARAAERSERHAAYRRAAQPQADDAPPATDPPAILLGDTLGELRKFYSLATVVFVGRTLVPLGGSDVMEVAGLARPMLFGPHTENFADAVVRLLDADAAIRIDSADQLAPQISPLLTHPDRAAALGAAARAVVRQNVGATARTVDLLCEELGYRSDHPQATIATRRLPAAPATNP